MNKTTKTLFIMPQSLGDLFMISSVMDGYHKKFPKEDLYLCTKRKYWWLFEGGIYKHPFIKGLLEYPDPFYSPLFRCAEHFTTHFVFDKIIRPFEKTQLDMHWVYANVFSNEQPMLLHYAEFCGLNKEEIGIPYVPDEYIKPLHLKHEMATYGEVEQPIIVIHPHTFDSAKRWDNFQELIDKLKDNFYIYQIGSKQDKLLDNVIDYREELYLHVLGLLHTSSFFIGIDSFWAHVAGYLDCKGVVLFGGTFSSYCSPYWGQLKVVEPKERKCYKKLNANYPCHNEKCLLGKENKCIDLISVDEVVSVLGEK